MRRRCILLLNFTDKEWESLKTLRDADREERDMVADVVANEIIGALEWRMRRRSRKQLTRERCKCQSNSYVTHLLGVNFTLFLEVCSPMV